MRGFLTTVLLISFFLPALAFAQNFSGVYTLKGPQDTITLTMNQNAQGQVSGLLSSTTGAKFNVLGQVDEDVVIGTCDQNGNLIPFEAHFETDGLAFTLIGSSEADSKVLYFKASKNMQQNSFVNSPSPGSVNSGKAGLPRSPFANSAPANSGQQAHQLTGNWICQTPQGTMTLNFLSSNQLNFCGSPAQYRLQGNNIIVSADGETLTYPYSFSGQQLIITFPEGQKAAFVKSQGNAMTNASHGGQTFSQLIGRWKDIRSSGHTIIQLNADGTFSYYSDYAAGNSNVNETNWGYANSGGMQGTWKAVGTQDDGTIYYQAQNGESGTLEYHIHREKGQKYINEFIFDGVLYQRQ
jgi:hypothetical protein